jgi:isopenicillin N synthase-like dioxygenase
MQTAPSFLGYSRLNAETTAFATDHREQIDLSTPHPLPSPTAPLYHNHLAPTLWPSASILPNFRPVFEDYIARMGAISMFFTSLIAEAIGLGPDAFDRYFDKDQQHKLKIVKYPDLAELGIEEGVEGQGVGPHKDSMLSSYLLQASQHRGLQVQNTKGEWVDCPPIDGTLVVAIGQGMEALTQGVCASTTHRVLSPAWGSGARYSIPFFQGVSYDATFESMAIPEELKELRRKVLERNGGRLDDVEFTFKTGKYKHLGEATLMNRIKSHPDVGERWYPEQLKQIREDQRKEKEEKERQVKAAEVPKVEEARSTAVEAH